MRIRHCLLVGLLCDFELSAVSCNKIPILSAVHTEVSYAKQEAISFVKRYPTISKICAAAFVGYTAYHLYQEYLKPCKVTYKKRLPAVGSNLTRKCLTLEGIYSLNRTLDTNAATPFLTQPARVDIKPHIRMDQFKDLLTLSAIQNIKVADSNYKRDHPAYIQKIDIAPSSELFTHGDMHGDAISIVQWVQEFRAQGYFEPDSYRLAKEHCYFVFLGDYVDRGAYGVEVMALLCLLKLANPDRVFLVRGNHEELHANIQDGFAAELRQKFQDPSLVDVVANFYNSLPEAIFVGCNGKYTQLCHGGLPASVDQYGVRWQVELAKLTYFLYQQPGTVTYLPDISSNNGFAWSDVDEQKDSYISSTSRRGCNSCCVGYQGMKDYCMQVGLLGMVCGHGQRAELNLRMKKFNALKGAITFWESERVKRWQKWLREKIKDCKCGQYSSLLSDSLVHMLQVSPDSVYGIACGYNYDTFMKIVVHRNPKKWKRTVMWLTTVDEQGYERRI